MAFILNYKRRRGAAIGLLLSYLLMETGDALLTEAGDYLILE